LPAQLIPSLRLRSRTGNSRKDAVYITRQCKCGHPRRALAICNLTLANDPKAAIAGGLLVLQKGADP